MVKILSLVLIAGILVSPAVWAQKPNNGGQRESGPFHEIPLDNLGNVLRIEGGANSKSPDTPNGHFNIRFPRRRARGVQITSGKIAIKGATVHRAGVNSRGLIKSPIDYVNINDAGNEVEFSTRTQDGVLKLPLAAEKDTDVVILLYLETDDGEAGFRYFLSPGKLSFEPAKKEAGKKRK